MKLLMLISVLWMLSYTSTAQQIYFNQKNNGNIMTFPTSNWYTSLVFSHDSTAYIVSGAIRDPMNPNTGLWRNVKYSSNGQLIWEKAYGTNEVLSGTRYGSMSIWKNEYITTGGFYKPGDFTYILVAAFNEDGDTTYFRTIQDTTAELASEGLKVQPDNKILIIGKRAIHPDTSDILLIKLDSNANELWRKTYNSGQVEGATSIDLASDGGYLIAGWRLLNGQHQARFFKTDSLGELEWNRWLTFDHEVWIRAKYLNNGDILVCGSAEPFVGSNKYAYVARYNHNGTVMHWERIIQGHLLSHLDNFIELDNGDLFLNGGKRIVSGWMQGWFLKLDASGNTIWERHLTDFTHHQYPFAVVQNPDKGFTVAGYGWDVGGMSQGWIARYDSNGCESPVCFTPVEEYEPAEGFEVFPNPSNGSVTLRGRNITGAQGEVYETATGRLIRRFTVSGHQHSEHGLPPGSFILRLTAGDKVHHKKLIVVN